MKTLKEKPIEAKQEVKTAITQQDIQGKEEMSMQITPLGDRILVKPLEAEEKTKGGIILPDTAKEKPQEGRVVAVGKGKVLDDGKVQPLEVKPGDKILYGKYSGTEIKLEDEEHLIIREEDVLAIITE
jgi:chaperonin GroES